MAAPDDHSLRDCAPIDPSHVRYIKLGPGGAWFDHALAHNLIELGHAAIPPALARGGDRAAIRAAFAAGGHAKNATDFSREVVDFATLPATALWITFERGLLWWAFAAPGLIELPKAQGRGVHARRLIAPWRSSDLTGAPLRMEQLSGKLTRVAGYRRSICKVEAAAYAVRCINAAPSPLLQRAAAAHAQMIAATGDLIAELDPSDFEVLVDLIFAHSGWRRVSALGGVQADTDLVLVQPVTGERAFVQVKSGATKQVFEASVDKYRKSAGLSRMVFACHSPKGNWASPAPDVTLWTKAALADQALGAGLFNWLCERTR